MQTQKQCEYKKEKQIIIYGIKVKKKTKKLIKNNINDVKHINIPESHNS